MPVTPEELLTALEAMTPEMAQSALEKVAPYTRAPRIKAQLQARLSDINSGTARARAIIDGLVAQVDAGNYDVTIPTFDELTTAFRGA